MTLYSKWISLPLHSLSLTRLSHSIYHNFCHSLTYSFFHSRAAHTGIHSYMNYQRHLTSNIYTYEGWPGLSYLLCVLSGWGCHIYGLLLQHDTSHTRKYICTFKDCIVAYISSIRFSCMISWNTNPLHGPRCNGTHPWSCCTSRGGTLSPSDTTHFPTILCLSD
jgi:hypothetical protein